jgi:hypothetical protein
MFVCETHAQRVARCWRVRLWGRGPCNPLRVCVTSSSGNLCRSNFSRRYCSAPTPSACRLRRKELVLASSTRGHRRNLIHVPENDKSPLSHDESVSQVQIRFSVQGLSNLEIDTNVPESGCDEEIHHARISEARRLQPGGASGPGQCTTGIKPTLGR